MKENSRYFSSFQEHNCTCTPWTSPATQLVRRSTSVGSANSDQSMSPREIDNIPGSTSGNRKSRLYCKFDDFTWSTLQGQQGKGNNNNWQRSSLRSLSVFLHPTPGSFEGCKSLIIMLRR
ncbi:hypothetical protein E1B28_009911 [Marasmius oreades]|uniref:Uncharacterized protein n=1 Tax=Marasmius oreades TaxID=181124 RepID=A0A9P7UT44_9AGAR|nr:uncharacterized protein E1B28_009911 [Marasmius oreades]KAG7090829.1 hypothetical protein E1B28_009911 [Marasmius oreades]